MQNILYNEKEKKLNSISITYLERMIEGINPVYNTSIEDDSVITDENVKRCFSFVLEMLKRIEKIEEINSYKSSDYRRVKRNNAPVELTEDYKKVIESIVKNTDLRMMKFSKILNKSIRGIFKSDIKISTQRISNWLLDEGYLEILNDENGKPHRLASEKGIQVGIINKVIENGDMPSYTTYTFPPQAQRFLYTNMKNISTHKRIKR